MFDDLIKKKYSNELQKISSFEKFDYNTVKLSSLSPYIKRFIQTESPDIRTKEKLFSLIEKSIILKINYTLRPNWTLLNFLFGGYDSKPAEDVVSKLKIFDYYKYYLDNILNYINDVGLVVLTRKRTEEILLETNQLLYTKFVTDLTSVKIKNFFLYVYSVKSEDSFEITLESVIPYFFIRLFLEDKKPYFQDLIEKFKNADDYKDSDELDFKTVIKILLGKYESLAGTKPRTEEFDTYSADSLYALNMQGKKNDRTEETKNIFEVTVPKTDIEEHDMGIKNGLVELFSKEELDFIIKKLFRADKTLFNETFRKLSAMNRWDDAMDFLKKYFIENNININRKKIIKFVDKLNDYFLSKERAENY